MDRFRTQPGKSGPFSMHSTSAGDTAEPYGVTKAMECKDSPAMLESQLTRNAAVKDLWNNYVLETLQRKGSTECALPFFSNTKTFITPCIGCHAVADGQISNELVWVSFVRSWSSASKSKSCTESLGEQADLISSLIHEAQHERCAVGIQVGDQPSASQSSKDLQKAKCRLVVSEDNAKEKVRVSIYLQDT